MSISEAERKAAERLLEAAQSWKALIEAEIQSGRSSSTARLIAAESITHAVECCMDLNRLYTAN